MIVISIIEDGGWMGGYGDRITGLISLKTIADCLGREFKILWTKENIKEYFDYSKYDYELCDISDELKIHEIQSVDNQTLFKNMLMTSDDPFNDGIYKIKLNQEISQYLYKNPKYCDKNHFDDIINIYRSLYTDILIPTPFLLNQINSIINNNSNIIGIQIRAGDCYMKTNVNEPHCVIQNPEQSIEDILYKIKKHIELNFNNYKIFITSDYSDIYNISKKVFDECNILWFDQEIQHMDRYPVGDFSKIFIDNYILSQKTEQLYISDYSNYGRVAALSSNKQEIFNLNCNKLEKKNLLSKHELIL
jgi:hypothetical protein